MSGERLDDLIEDNTPGSSGDMRQNYGHHSSRRRHDSDDGLYSSTSSEASSSSDLSDRSLSSDPLSSSDSDYEAREACKKRVMRKRGRNGHSGHGSRHGNYGESTQRNGSGKRGVITKYGSSGKDGDGIDPPVNTSTKQNESVGFSQLTGGAGGGKVQLRGELAKIFQTVREVDRGITPTYEVTPETNWTGCVWFKLNSLIADLRGQSTQLRFTGLPDAIGVDPDELVLLTGAICEAIDFDDGDTGILYGLKLMAKRSRDGKLEPMTLSKHASYHNINPVTGEMDRFHHIVGGVTKCVCKTKYSTYPKVMEKAGFKDYARLIAAGKTQESVAQLIRDHAKLNQRTGIAEIESETDLSELILYGGGARAVGVPFFDKYGNRIREYTDLDGKQYDPWRQEDRLWYLRMPIHKLREWARHIVPLIEALKNYFFLPDTLVIEMTPLVKDGFAALLNPRQYVEAKNKNKLGSNYVKFQIQMHIGVITKAKTIDVCPVPE